MAGTRVKAETRNLERGTMNVEPGNRHPVPGTTSVVLLRTFPVNVNAREPEPDF
jgi:hypothetical protein